MLLTQPDRKVLGYGLHFRYRFQSSLQRDLWKCGRRYIPHLASCRFEGALKKRECADLTPSAVQPVTAMEERGLLSST